MEIIFCKIKKMSIVILLVLLIVMSITPVVQAANITVGRTYKYNGTGLVIFSSAKAAKWMNILSYGNPKWLYPGSIIEVFEISGNAVKIGEGQYININAINKGKFYDHIKVKDILLETTKATLKIGDDSGDDRKQLKATIVPDNANNKGIIWESLNPDIATVDKNGLVIGIKKGTAIIKVKSAESNIEKQCTVEVKQKAMTVELNVKNATMTIGDGKTLDLIATVTPEDANNKNVTWITSDKSIATVKDGKVTAVGTKKGTNVSEVTITATTKNGLASASCKVKVQYIPVTEIKGIPSEIDIIKNESATKTLTPTIEPNNASNKGIKWSSNNKNIVTVDKGEIKAVGPGTAKVTASIETRNSKGENITISKTCEVTVKIAATGISLKEGLDKTIYIGDILTLTPIIEPSNATNKSVTWASSKKTVATVSDGKVTALKEGTTNITATTANGKYTVTCKVTVKDPYKNDYTVNKGTADEVTYTYKLAVKSQKLNEVVKLIGNNHISQQYGGSDHCDEIANYHIYLLLGFNKVHNENIDEYTLAEALRVGDNGGNVTKKSFDSTLFSSLKKSIDNKKPARLHVWSGTSGHWVAVVGYKGLGDTLDDYLIISCYQGVLISGGKSDAKKLNGREFRTFN